MYVTVHCYKEVKLDVGKESKLVVMFDPAYRPDRHSRAHNSSIEVSYKEHPHKARKQLQKFLVIILNTYRTIFL